MTYRVNVYAIQHPNGRTLVHLSNPALYVTCSDNTTVTFADGFRSGLSWSIVFKDDNTPFTASGVDAGTHANPIGENTGALQIKNNIPPGDYNYCIQVAGGGMSDTEEDPQVIIGGKGSSLALLLAAGAAGLAVATLLACGTRNE